MNSPLLPPTPIDGRSAANVATLLPAAQRAARAFLLQANSGFLGAEKNVVIICGTRSWPEQDALFAQGRNGNPGPVVTNARGGQSNHNFGIAFDIAVFRDDCYLKESPDYAHLGQIAPGLGLEWGGAWPSFPDEPHYQLATPYNLKQAYTLKLAHQWDQLFT